MDELLAALAKRLREEAEATYRGADDAEDFARAAAVSEALETLARVIEDMLREKSRND